MESEIVASNSDFKENSISIESSNMERIDVSKNLISKSPVSTIKQMQSQLRDTGDDFISSASEFVSSCGEKNSSSSSLFLAGKIPSSSTSYNAKDLKLSESASNENKTTIFQTDPSNIAMKNQHFSNPSIELMASQTNTSDIAMKKECSTNPSISKMVEGKVPVESMIRNDGIDKKPLVKKKHFPVSENQERMNYLIQASKYINSLPNAEGYNNMDTYLGSLAMAIGRKCVIRTSPSVKRFLCKGCGSFLIPSITAKFRLKKKRQKHMVVTCSKCVTIKRFNTKSDYVLWCDKPEALAD